MEEIMDSMIAHWDVSGTILYALVFFLLAFGFFGLFRSVTMMEKAKDGLQKVWTNLHNADEKRVLELEAERRLSGTTSKDGKKSSLAKFLENIDDVIIYSGMRAQYPWLNTTLYISLSVLAWAIVLMILLITIKHIVVSLAVPTILILVPYVYMSTIKDNNFKKTEKQLLFFINMVANMSQDTSDLVNIFENISGFVNEPISIAIMRAVSRARVSGVASDCIETLTREIEHPIFKRYIRTLEIASRNDGDYRTISRDFATQAEREIRSMERRREIFRDGRNEIMLLGVLGIGLNIMMCSLVEMSFVEVVMGMKDSLFGIVVMIVEVAVYIAVAMYIFVGGRK